VIKIQPILDKISTLLSYLILLNNEIQINIVIGVFFVSLIAFFSYRIKFLSLSGSIAAFFVGSLIFGFGGLKWSMPVLVFFFTSSILSKIHKNDDVEAEEYSEKTSKRDFFQVLANGGLSAVFICAYLILHDEKFYLMNLASLSVVCSDTWATEIGTLKINNTYNIMNFRHVKQGTSGGVSLNGTVGAILGAVLIAVSGLAFNKLPYIQYLILIITCGIFGNFTDSLLGASLQILNKCTQCRILTEKKIHCGCKTVRYKGVKFFNNDMVNFVSALAGAVMLIILKSLLIL
jgi:uncharacterized protein (TIGR00297 family)